MTTLAKRLDTALKLAEKSPADLARATGKSESAVSQWLSGKSKSMRSDSLMATAALLGCNAQWLASGKGIHGMGLQQQAPQISITANDGWPFDPGIVNRQMYEALSPAGKTIVQVKLLEAIREEESQSAKQQSAHKTTRAA